eukprot:TRINITY_DN6231_c2_g1_i1.p1 TRINITY_DN6231_c2_g1~~TRINITY_DN6231_c2_g1_i1.p1  ORF type:complete len:1158 (+),score=462.41 TRINITY_DN6231_c2_g1_i1:43-3474(+)
MASRRQDAQALRSKSTTAVAAAAAQREPRTRGEQPAEEASTGGRVCWGLFIAIVVVALVMVKKKHDAEQNVLAPRVKPAEPCPTLGRMRQNLLQNAGENIFLDTFDAVKREERAEAIGQRGVTLWMTGLSGAGKTAVAKELERQLVLEEKMHVYRLEGDNMKFGLSKDLQMGPEDKTEALRRAYEVSAMMADAGTVSVVSFISPYNKDREEARHMHASRGLPFLEVYVQAPIEEVRLRDPHDFYKRHSEGGISGIAGLDAPYEAPTSPDVVLKTHECCGDMAALTQVDDCKRRGAEGERAAEDARKYQNDCPEVVRACVQACVRHLRTHLVEGKFLDVDVPKTPAPPQIVERIIEKPAEPCPTIQAGKQLKAECQPQPEAAKRATGHADGYPFGTTPPSLIEGDEAYWHSDAVTKLQPVPISDSEVQWVQVIGEGWAAPLRGPMREAALVQVLHFESMLFSPDSDGAGNSGYGTGPKPTQFGDYAHNSEMVKDGVRVNMPVPIVISISKHSKMLIERQVAMAKELGVEQVQVTLVGPSGEPVAVLNDPEVYEFRKEEMIARSWGSWDMGHPYIKENVLDGDEYLLGGEFHKVRRIRYRDGLDRWRLTPQEVLQEFQARNADAVFAFQTRNPTHAGHAHLMKDGRKQLLDTGLENPVLWLSPLGGWTKNDDVPLDVRVKQHQAVLDEKMLDKAWTVLSIWPSPMVYSGPTEVQWHAKSRRVAGADYFIVGRDPAGLGYSDQHQSKGEDVYQADHGRYVLQMSPGMGGLGLLASGAVHYDTQDGEMRPKPDGISKEEFSKRFLKISGSKMRKMGKMKVDMCKSLDDIPKDWADNPSCVPPNFMVPTGWDIMKDYYVHKDEEDVIANAIVYSKQRPEVAALTKVEFATKVGLDGNQYSVYVTNDKNETISPWHDVPIGVAGEGNIVNMVVEFPRGTNAKYEVQKNLPHNPIKQDTKDGRARYYTYGLAFFNNGLIPQTWENSGEKDEEGNLGDNDPLDIMEIGSTPLPMGSVVRVKVLGSIGMLDGGETDHKVIAIALDDPLAAEVNNIEDLKELKAAGVDLPTRIREWLRRYKTTDKSDPDEAKLNTFLNDGKFHGPGEAMKIIEETHKQWSALKKGKAKTDLTRDFWLSDGGAAEFEDALKLAA